MTANKTSQGIQKSRKLQTNNEKNQPVETDMELPQRLE